jgi:hypothetical protein
MHSCQLKSLWEAPVVDLPSHQPGSKAQVTALLLIHFCPRTGRIESEGSGRWLSIQQGSRQPADAKGCGGV